MFHIEQFIAGFDARLLTLTNSEKITKAELQTLSRDLLAQLHTDNKVKGDIGYINRTIAVLTPVNKKVFIAFCKEFTGYSMNQGHTMFEKKNKKQYDDVQKKALAWLDDVMNNIWSWADRNIEVVSKDFTLDVVTANTQAMLKKADKNGFSHVQVLEAMFKGGLTVEDLLAVVDKLGYEFGVEGDNAIDAMPKAEPLDALL